MADKPTLTNISGGRLNSDVVDGNFDILADNSENLLGRGGINEASNYMTGILDMNTQRIQNVGNPANSSDAVSLSYLNTVLNQSSDGGFASVYEAFTATAGQTLFTFASATYTQSVNQLIVLIQEAASSEQGYRRLGPEEITETSSSSFTLASAASNTDKVIGYITQPVATTDPTLIPAGTTLLEARDDAETAALAAETAQTGAETAETNAATSASNASTSASNAATSETNAAASATALPALPLTAKYGLRVADDGLSWAASPLNLMHDLSATILAGYYETVRTITDHPTPTIDLDTSNKFKWTLGLDRTFPLLSPSAEGEWKFYIDPNNYTLTFNAAYLTTGELPNKAADVIRVSLEYDGTNKLITVTNFGA